MALTQEIKLILKESLQLVEVDTWEIDTQILGTIPEFDSMAIMTVLTQIEDQYGIVIDDDELNAEVFETLGGIIEFVAEKTK